MDTTTLILIIVIVLVVAYMISRSRGGMYGGSPSYRKGNTGPQQPTYDDPDYTSAGSIGGAEAPPAAPQERSVGGGTGGRTYDDPNYRSGGSIGGS